MARAEKTVFISYRRADVPWALAIFKALANSGYDVFIDYTGIASGDFERIIVANIKSRAHFVVLLTPSALDRCAESEDMFRREIEKALDAKRNIVPLTFDGFDFKSPTISNRLTGKLALLKKYNALSIHPDFFEEAIARLETKFLNIAGDAVLHPATSLAQEAAQSAQVAALAAPVPRLRRKVPTAKAKSEQVPAPRRRKQTLPTATAKPEDSPSAEFRDGEGLPLMVTIPPGKFVMGSRDRYERPQRQVHIAYTLAVGKFPVTLGEWKRFVKASNYDEDAGTLTGEEERMPFAQDDDHPVTCVSWVDAKDYLAWLEAQTGRPYRLLTEAEWEYACRAGTTTKYAFGEKISLKQANFGGFEKGTTRVGSYLANRFGLCDMHGNVWEWVEDYYHYDYKGAPTDGSAWGPSKKPDYMSDMHSRRGGAWDEGCATSTTRAFAKPDVRISSMGFRVARTL